MGDKSSIIDKIVVGFIICIIGILIGCFLTEGKLIIIDNKVRISEVFGWFITIFVGFFIGYILKNKVENQKTVKNYLCNDLNDVIQIIKELNDIFYTQKKNQKFEAIEIHEMNSKINFIAKKLTSFSRLLQTSNAFNKSYCTKIQELLSNKQIELNNFVTGDSVYLAVIPFEFFEETLNCSIDFEFEIKNIILQISKN